MTRCSECDGRGEYLDAPINVLQGGRASMTTCHVCLGTGEILAPWQGGPPSPPFVSNIPSRAGAGDAPPMVDAWNTSSYD